MLENNLIGVKVGDWIWSIKYGWEKVVSITSSNYPVNTRQESFTITGREYIDDVAPSAFTEPPECFNAEPKPCKFRKGQKVLVSDHSSILKVAKRRYFSHMDEAGNYCCFVEGTTEWTSHGITTEWKYCIPAEEE